MRGCEAACSRWERARRKLKLGPRGAAVGAERRREEGCCSSLAHGACARVPLWAGGPAEGRACAPRAR